GSVGQLVCIAPVSGKVPGLGLCLPGQRPESALRLWDTGRTVSALCLLLWPNTIKREAIFIAREARQLHLRAGSDGGTALWRTLRFQRVGRTSGTDSPGMGCTGGRVRFGRGLGSLVSNSGLGAAWPPGPARSYVDP